jgi:hypothetical protein
MNSTSGMSNLAASFEPYRRRLLGLARRFPAVQWRFELSTRIHVHCDAAARISGRIRGSGGRVVPHSRA